MFICDDCDLTVQMGALAGLGLDANAIDADGDLPFDAAAVARFVEGDRRLLPELRPAQRERLLADVRVAQSRANALVSTAEQWGLGAWTEHRDFPAPEGRTFMARYASGEGRRK